LLCIETGKKIKRKTTSILLKIKVLSLKIKNNINPVKKIMYSFNIQRYKIEEYYPRAD